MRRDGFSVAMAAMDGGDVMLVMVQLWLTMVRRRAGRQGP